MNVKNRLKTIPYCLFNSFSEINYKMTFPKQLLLTDLSIFPSLQTISIMYSQLKKFCDNECSKYNIKLNCLVEGEIEINPILYNTIIELEITVLFQTNIDLNVFPYLMKLTINYPLMSINLNKIMNETILLDLIKINIPTYSD